MEDQGTQYDQERFERRLPKDQPWEVDIDVYLYDDTDPEEGFKVESVLPIDDSDPKIKYIIFNNNGRPGFKLLFHLHDETGQGYQFAADEDDAVWSMIGPGKCPDAAEHAVLKPLRVKEEGTLLVVENKNEEPIGKFRYTLRVGKGGKPPYLPLDPGGVDQNGPRTFRFR